MFRNVFLVSLLGMPMMVFAADDRAYPSERSSSSSPGFQRAIQHVKKKTRRI